MSTPDRAAGLDRALIGVLIAGSARLLAIASAGGPSCRLKTPPGGAARRSRHPWAMESPRGR